VFQHDGVYGSEAIKKIKKEEGKENKESHPLKSDHLNFSTPAISGWPG
jgi:hypothetical protein